MKHFLNLKDISAKDLRILMMPKIENLEKTRSFGD